MVRYPKIDAAEPDRDGKGCKDTRDQANLFPTGPDKMTEYGRKNGDDDDGKS